MNYKCDYDRFMCCMVQWGVFATVVFIAAGILAYIAQG